MDRLERRLGTGETVRLRGRIHPAVWVRPGAVLGIGLFALLGAPGPAGVLATVAGVVDAIGRGLRVLRSQVLVTDRRVLACSGVFRVRSAAAAKPESVELLEDGFSRRFGFVFLRLPGDDGQPLTVPFVADSAAVRRALGRPEPEDTSV